MKVMHACTHYMYTYSKTILIPRKIPCIRHISVKVHEPAPEPSKSSQRDDVARNVHHRFSIPLAQIHPGL